MAGHCQTSRVSTDLWYSTNTRTRPQRSNAAAGGKRRRCSLAGRVPRIKLLPLPPASRASEQESWRIPSQELPTPTTLAELPLRAELFSVAQLQQHARSLA